MKLALFNGSVCGIDNAEEKNMPVFGMALACVSAAFVGIEHGGRISCLSPLTLAWIVWGEYHANLSPSRIPVPR
jgi:hypothetical protein